ncbi:hypothetical protein RFI_07835 [Reticulomyxa filosa]|uniref:histone deacetylase n=1 Tax=Reticulomyxa filosa TaxID=46433 RepID=X6NU26_RETFI|nr:hypothetical protein RFI_07835 [Reticulomyxa filosa]|eukprot:ETO29289.1 hypothetical protein RFI_07835 [Reticulomyxa filosa]
MRTRRRGGGGEEEEEEEEGRQAREKEKKERAREKYKNDKCKKRYAVTLNRPPGHHCDGQRIHGYCYINNVAASIDRVCKVMDTKMKILVLDVDVHHGDGTQKLFYSNPNVLTISFHQFDGTFFPCTGERKEYGPSRGHAAYGTNINIPLHPGATDYDLLYALRNVVWPIVDEFQPEIAYYAVGTDGVDGDRACPDTKLSPLIYGQVCYELMSRCSKIVVTTEGGYTTSFLADGMNSVMQALTGSHNVNIFPSSFAQAWIRPETKNAVECTRSDLKKIYRFPDLVYDNTGYEDWKQPQTSASHVHTFMHQIHPRTHFCVCLCVISRRENKQETRGGGGGGGEKKKKELHKTGKY